MSSSEEKPALPDDPDTSNLSDDLKSFLMECYRDFEKRYTEEDEDFAAHFEREPPAPPIVSPWYGFSKNRDRGGSRNHDRRHNYQRNYDNYRNQNSYGHHHRYNEYHRRNDRGHHRR